MARLFGLKTISCSFWSPVSLYSIAYWNLPRNPCPGTLESPFRSPLTYSSAASTQQITEFRESSFADPSIAAGSALIAFALRVGLGAVFIAGGIAKLERLLTPMKAKGIVDQYVGPLGYINQTFLDWLFAKSSGMVLTPWNFLTALSAFELISGVMLVAGLMVPPLSAVSACRRGVSRSRYRS